MRVLSVCLDLGGVASHRTAAALHGLAGFGPGVVEVSVVKGSSTRTRTGVVHTTTNLGPDDLVQLGEIPATSVARTLFGLAALVPDVTEERVRDAVDCAVRDGQASDSWLWWRLERLRCRGRNGVAVMEDVLRARAGIGPTESWLECVALNRLAAAGLPRPVVQQRIRLRGAFVARVDLCYPAERVVIELIGYDAHSSRAQMIAGANRRNELQLAGWEVLEFTYDDVVRAPERFVGMVARTLAARAGVGQPRL